MNRDITISFGNSHHPLKSVLPEVLFKIGNSIILEVLNIYSGYSTFLIFPLKIRKSLLLNVSYIPGYPHHSTIGIGAVVSVSVGSYWSIGVTSTSSGPWALLKLVSAEQDSMLLSSSSSVGCGVWGGETAGFFLLGPFNGDSDSWATTFLPFAFLVAFPFVAAFPVVVFLYNSPLLSLETSKILIFCFQVLFAS